MQTPPCLGLLALCLLWVLVQAEPGRRLSHPSLPDTPGGRPLLPFSVTAITKLVADISNGLDEQQRFSQVRIP